MASALDWLNQATAALSDTRKETMEWEKKRRETDDQLNIYKRVGSVAEVDKNLSSKHAELSMLTSSAKARAQAALELVKEDEGIVGVGGGATLTTGGTVLKKKKKKVGKLATMKFAEGGERGGEKGGGRKGLRSSQALGGGKALPKALPGQHHQHQKGGGKGAVVHKSTTNLNGIYHLIVVKQTDGHVVFEATDQETKEVYLTKTKAKASVKVIDKAVRKDEAAVAIQSVARKRIMYNSFKPKMMKIKLESMAAKRIQALMRGVKCRGDLKRPQMEYRAARRIATRIRGILARMLLQEMREEREACLRIQAQMRGKAARGVVSARRKQVRGDLEVKSASVMQRQMRMTLARRQVGEKREQKKSATVISTKWRQRRAREEVGRRREERSAAILIQGRARMRKAQLRVEVRREYVMDLKNNSALVLQRAARGKGAKRKVEGMRVERKSCVLVQSHIRKSLARSEVADRRRQRDAATVLQGRVRMQASGKIAGRKREERNAATVLQTRVRVRKAEKRVQARREFVRDLQSNSALVLQRVARRKSSTRVVEGMRKERDSAVLVQAHIRKVLARQEVNDLRTEKKAAVCVQAHMRASIARNVVEGKREQRDAATLLQGRVRIRRAKGKAKARREYKADLQNNLEREMAVMLQSQMRMTLARGEVWERRERRRACVVVQCRVREIQARSYVDGLRKIRDNIRMMQLQIRRLESSVVIQKLARAILAKGVVARLRARRVEEEKMDEERRMEAKRVEQAACTIGRRIRVSNAKTLLKNKRIEQFAAIVIQSRCRVQQSKIRVGRARAAAAQEERARREMEEQKRASAVKLQCLLRGRRANKLRNVLAQERMGAIVMQCMWRRRKAGGERKARAAERDRVRDATAREREVRRREEAVKIQTRIRTCLARWTVREMVETRRVEGLMATTIQKVWRKFESRGKFVELVGLHNAAIFIQCQARVLFGKAALKERRLMKENVKWQKMVRIQCVARQCLSRWEVREKRERRDAVLCVQRAVRCWKCRERVKDLRFMRGLYVAKVVLVQSLWRGRTAVKWWKQWREWWEWEKVNAILIQKVARGWYARRDMKAYLKFWNEFAMACVIQKRWRGVKVRGGRKENPVFLAWAKHAPHLLMDGGWVGWEPTFGDSEPPVAVDALGREWVWNVEAESVHGETLLMAAAGAGEEGLVRGLLEAGGGKDRVDWRGESAAFYAFRNGHSDLGYSMIDDFGCNDGIENRDGEDCYAVVGAANVKRPNMYLGDGALGSNIAVEYDE
ncbi:hypothetical protein TrRE_jg3749 [Triparma retinervis]|uniref:Uncharacterized protein n=1 Tax=Triparma retinervis TaxID=2557542 RepID=A0A9W7AAF1_9STRA|nr:hypothetical protein TrRE_jg3749 [Triparma retinervis]